MMPSSTVFHNFFRDLVYSNPNAAVRALSQPGRLDNLRMLDWDKHKIINRFVERQIKIPRSRRIAHRYYVPDYHLNIGNFDVGWIQQSNNGIRRKTFTTFEIKTGNFYPNEMICKYAGSLFSENMFSNEYYSPYTICSNVEHPLYLLGWHERIIESLPKIKNDVYLYLIKKGIIKIAPLEWIFNDPAFKNNIIDSGLAITDDNILDRVELVCMVPKVAIYRYLPDYSDEWKRHCEDDKKITIGEWHQTEELKIKSAERNQDSLFDGF